MNQRWHTFALILVLATAALLRFYRIGALAEFLGDQGRTGIVIFDALESRKWPLVGPPVLTGQYLGPFFYYFIGLPFIVSGFRPELVSGFLAVTGVATVYLVFYLVSKLVGFWPAIALAALYATTPSIVSSDRVIWEPNIIPFFVFLYLVTVYKVYKERRLTALIFMGIVVGILVQLHYPNILFIFLSCLFWTYLILERIKHGSISKLILWSMGGVLSFLLVMAPFAFYEFNHQWRDLREIALIFLSQGEQAGVGGSWLGSVFELSGRVFGKLLPFKFGELSIAVLVILGMILWRGGFWAWFLSLWYLAGIIAMSFYRGVVFDHYLNFLLPLPFLLLALFYAKVRRFLPPKLWFILLVILIVINLKTSDIFSTGVNDIPRTRKVTNEIKTQAKGETFSFTLVSSRSFSDLHYRYFFLTSHTFPASIGSNNYNLLFLVCEKTPCPVTGEMEVKTSVSVLCYEPHCSGPYPTINLTAWQPTLTKDVAGSRLYTYRRRPGGIDLHLPPAAAD